MIHKNQVIFGFSALLLLIAAASCKTPDGNSGVKADGDGTTDAPIAPQGAGVDATPAAAAANGASTYAGPPGQIDAATNAVKWAQYCIGSSDVAGTVNPNYADPLVLHAAQILSIVKGASFKVYADMLKMHQTPAPAAPAGLTKDAHNFLSYLCGEFRDRASMIEAKLRWVENIRYLSKGGTTKNVSCANGNDALKGNVAEAAMPQTTPFDKTKSPWMQMCMEDYQPYYTLTRAIFDQRQAMIASTGLEIEGQTVSGKLKIGTREGIDRHVPGFTICETKYQFAQYIKPKKKYTAGNAGYKSYMTAYKTFQAGCTAEDKDWYYDFRGDSNFKPNSPEGNAMIWQGKVFAAQCASRTKAKGGGIVTDDDCRKYYENPFKSRFLAARAGLGAWLLQSRELEPTFASAQGEYYTVVNHAHNNPADIFSWNGPFLFRTNDNFSGSLQTVGQPGQYLPGFEAKWGAPDYGMVELAGLSGEEAKQFVYEKLQRAVDRHTNWYKSSYDSAPSLPMGNAMRRTIDQAFSPFVASSYEMSESNNFTQCGLTIPCAGNNPDFIKHKQWMFIFKVKKENWLRPEDIANGNVTPALDRMWMDETSFGDDGLANQERAWDRLGSPLEDEHAEILYLWRMPSGQ